jgi:hypothetical protein
MLHPASLYEVVSTQTIQSVPAGKVNTVTWQLKAAICPSAGRGFTEGATAGRRIVGTRFHRNEYDWRSNALHTESRRFLGNAWRNVSLHTATKLQSTITAKNAITPLLKEVRLKPTSGRDSTEYLHRTPASHRRRRKGKSQIWDSKIWSRVSRDSDPKMTWLVKASRNCTWQNRPLVKESAPHQQTSICLTVIQIWS